MFSSTSDSLNNELIKHKKIEDKIHILNQLGANMLEDSPQVALKYLDSAYFFSKKYSNKKGIADSYYFKGILHYNFNELVLAADNLKISYKIYSEIKDTNNIKDLLSILGYIYYYLGDSHKSLHYYSNLKEYYKSNNNLKGVSETYTYLGNVYLNESKYFLSLNMYYESLKNAKLINNEQLEANSYVNIGIVYNLLFMFNDAKDFNLRALAINKRYKDNENIANNLLNLAKIYRNQNKLDSSMTFLKESLVYAEQSHNLLLITNILSEKAYLHTTKSEIDEAIKLYKYSIKVNDSINNHLFSSYDKASLARLYLKQKINYEEILPLLNDAFQTTKTTNDIKLKELIYYGFAEYYEKKNDLTKALQYYKLYMSARDSIFSSDIKKEAGRLEGKYEMEAELAKQQRNQEIKESKQNFIINSAILGLIALIVFLFFLWRERSKSEKLLLNILPKSIEKRLKRKIKYIADSYENVTVVFIDISNFTDMSKSEKPEYIVNMLNKIYTEFDKVADKYSLEKIKTIGDCYMAAAGIPDPNENHCIAAANFTLEVMKKMQGYKIFNGKTLSFKVGIDCGPVVAGVIGEKKFIYDLWGDVVNTASRMEQYSDTGKIQVTERFVECLQKSSNNFSNPNFNLILRGDVKIKGKGIMKTYWMEYD